MSYKNWIPYSISDESSVNWLFLGEKRYLEPFFEETIHICRRQPDNQKSIRQTDLAELNAACKEITTVQPNAFIFHISRCGSTLLTQLLSLQEANIVVSEAPILDTVLRWKYNAPSVQDDFRHTAFKNCVQILGQKRFDYEQHFFIKLDSWHLIFLEEIRKLFPDTPFIFMTRDLDAIRRSHQKMAGMHAVPGMLEPEIFDLRLPDVLYMHDSYLKHVLQKMLESVRAFRAKDGNNILLEYEDGAYPNYIKVHAFLGLELDENTLRLAKERLKFHSKIPNEQFEPVP